MKVFRFMSAKEFTSYLNGNTITNTNPHNHHNTSSTGFCFMDTNDYEPEFAYQFLSGIVSNDICCIFETDASNLTESYGVYADPYGSFFDTMVCTEYYTPSYNKNSFKLICYAKDFSLWSKFNWIYDSPCD